MKNPKRSNLIFTKTWCALLKAGASDGKERGEFEMVKLQYVMDLKHNHFGCTTNSADYATESILLFRDELDANLLPDIFDKLCIENEVLVHYFSVGIYVVYIITDVCDLKCKLLGVLQGHKLIYYQLFD